MLCNHFHEEEDKLNQSFGRRIFEIEYYRAAGEAHLNQTLESLPQRGGSPRNRGRRVPRSCSGSPLAAFDPSRTSHPPQGIGDRQWQHISQVQVNYK